MKKITLLFSLSFVLLLTGCFEIIQETTIKADESGIFKSTTDLSPMIGMAKMLGESDDLKKVGDAKDTTMSLAKLADSIQGLSDIEKGILKKGSLNLVINVVDEKLLVTFIFPYTNSNDLTHMSGLLKKIRKEVVGKQMDALSGKGEETKMIGEGVSETTEIDEFFDIIHTKGLVSKKINAERYANVQNDQGLKSLQEMSQMGSPMTTKVILNLPKPAKKIEAKDAEISADKKKITITATIDDLFNDPTKFEYRIEY